MSEFDEKLEEVFGLAGTMHLHVKSILAMVRMKALHGVTDPGAFTEEEKNVCFNEVSGPADRLMEILLPLICERDGEDGERGDGDFRGGAEKDGPEGCGGYWGGFGGAGGTDGRGGGGGGGVGAVIAREEMVQVFLILCGLVLASRGDQRALRELSEEEQEDVGTWARAGCRMIERVLGKEGREDGTRH